MGTDQIMYCIISLILGMLLANMLKSICGCKTVVEGGNTLPTCDPNNWYYIPLFAGPPSNTEETGWYEYSRGQGKGAYWNAAPTGCVLPLGSAPLFLTYQNPNVDYWNKGSDETGFGHYTRDD